MGRSRGPRPAAHPARLRAAPTPRARAPPIPRVRHPRRAAAAGGPASRAGRRALPDRRARPSRAARETRWPPGPPAHQLPRPAQVPQVAHADAPSPVLVLIGGPDAPAGGPDLLSSLTRPVEQLVQWEGQVRTVRYVKLV